MNEKDAGVTDNLPRSTSDVASAGSSSENAEALSRNVFHVSRRKDALHMYSSNDKIAVH